MRKAILAALAACSLAAPAGAEPFRYEAPGRAARPSRHVLLYAPYDGADSFDAAFAVGDPRAGGMGASHEAAGRFGGAARVAGPSSSIHYAAPHNVCAPRGTVSLWVKGEGGGGLLDGRDHWLLNIRAQGTIGLLVRGNDRTLAFGFGFGWRQPHAATSVSVPFRGDPTAWHHVLASWDLERKRLWLGLDGSGVTQAFAGFPAHSPFTLFVGACVYDQGSDFPLNGLVDDLVLYDAPADRLAEPTCPKGLDPELLRRAELAARRFLTFWEAQQRGGGWGVMYAWPMMIPCSAQGRAFMEPYGFVSNDKGWSTPTVAVEYLYAAEIFGDTHYMDVARTAAEMYLGTLARDGAWSWGYQAASGLPIARVTGKVKMQDSNQSHPIFLLGYLYRLTGEERYVQGARAGGDLVLRAQNPNGSWSHSFDLKRGIGVTANGLPQGGEINDNCTNDAMEVMLFMYHLTKERKYADAVRRAGDWFVEAQSDGPTFGWAEQYDKDNHPVWARDFEPPADAPGRSSLAVRALQLMWYLTEDPKYLAPIARFCDWLEKSRVDGGWWGYYDPKTGRPVEAINNRSFFMDDPKQYAEYCSLILADAPRPRPERVVNVEAMRAWVERARKGQARPVLAEPTREECLAYCRGASDRIRSLVESQHSSGAWVRPRGGAGSWGAQTYPRDTNAVEVLRYVERARMALGELPLERRGDCDPLASAYPGADWYETPLRRAGN